MANRLKKIAAREPDRFKAMCRAVTGERRRYLQIFGCKHDWTPGLPAANPSLWLCHCRICLARSSRVAAVIPEDDDGE